MDTGKLDETMALCIKNGYFESNIEGVKLTKTGVDLLEEKIEKLHSSMKKQGTIPKNLPEEVSKKLVADTFLESMNNSTCSALVFLISEIEPIGYDNWIKFENLKTEGLLPN